MKFILCGKGDVAIRALDAMRRAGDEVWAVGTAGDDGRDGWQRSFRAAAEGAGVRFDQPRRINEEHFTERLAAFGADALVSIQYDQILKGPLFERLSCPALNLHFSLLPRHRGVAPIAWAILSGDYEAGATLHHMVVGIDAGDLIDQRRVEVRPTDSARDLYERVADAAGALFEASHPSPSSLLKTRRRQDGGASYHPAGAFDFSQRQVDWSRGALPLQRWLRAMIFPPLQLPETRLADRVIAIERVAGEIGPATGTAPGTVVAVGDAGVDVAAADGSVRLEGLEGINPGDRFEFGDTA